VPAAESRACAEERHRTRARSSPSSGLGHRREATASGEAPWRKPRSPSHHRSCADPDADSGVKETGRRLAQSAAPQWGGWQARGIRGPMTWAIQSELLALRGRRATTSSRLGDEAASPWKVLLCALVALRPGVRIRERGRPRWVAQTAADRSSPLTRQRGRSTSRASALAPRGPHMDGLQGGCALRTCDRDHP
jgi:hypothetical protein